MATLPAFLDPRQTTRIEAVHRGFLYQHLYAVGFLLLAEKHEVTSVSVERDEDIELLHGGRTYGQVTMIEAALQHGGLTREYSFFCRRPCIS